MKKITSIETYITAIMTMKREKEKNGVDSSQWFFRGQKDLEWSVTPNVFRDGGLKNEYNIIQMALRQNPFEFRTLTNFEILTKLQHYGLGTRLLDVTLNPLVALYFATEPAVTYKKGKDKRYSKKEPDGKLFYGFSPWHSIDELGVQIAMTIPFVKFQEPYTIADFLDRLYKTGVVKEDDHALLQADNYNLFIQYIQANYFIVATQSNERLIRQSGAFILPTAITVQKDGDDVGNYKIVKSHRTLDEEFNENHFVIPGEYKEQIRKELDFFNINESTMFPELEHQMMYIRHKNHLGNIETEEFQKYDYNNLKEEQPMESAISDKVADVQKVVDVVVPDIPKELRNQLIEKINMDINYIDWKNKYQIRSKIKLDVSRILQTIYPSLRSKKYAEQILELLLNPVENVEAKERLSAIV